jgi:hypothetical protein
LAVVLSLAILGASAQSASAALREVSPTGSDAAGNFCRLYETPCATISHAIEIAESGDGVDVHAGVYAEDLTIDKPLELIGPDGGARPGVPQAVVEGDSGTAIKVESHDVSIRGMTVTAGATGTAIRAPGTDIDKFVVQEDIIIGGSSGVRLEAGGDEDSIGYNRIEGAGDGIDLGGTAYSDLKIQWNRFVAPIAGYTVLAGSGTTIEGLRLEGNTMPAPVRIAARIEKPPNEENWIDENSFGSTGGPQLAIDGERLRVSRNTFEGHGIASCLQILGNQGGLSPSTEVIADGNSFIDCAPYGIELGPEVDEVGIYNDDFPGSYDGIATSNASPWNVAGRVRIRWNRFVGTGNRAVENLASGTLDAEQNWWGCNAGPGAIGCDEMGSSVDAGNAIELGARIGPRKKETGIIELPTGESITLNPGEQAEVFAVMQIDGMEFNPGDPINEAQIDFSSSLGSLSPASSRLQNGWAIAVFTAGKTPGQGWITLSMDNQRTLVPVTICCTTSAPPTTPTLPMPPIENPPPPTTPAQKPHAPTLEVTRKRHVLAGRWATVGSISCGDSCRVASGPVRIIIGRHRYRGVVAPRGILGAGSTTPIRVAFPRPARQALRKFGSAWVRATETVVDAEGQSATRALSVKIID